MSVRARIKILECKSFQEVEDKVNDFLAFNKDIEHVARINYQLEYNVVIVEYIVFGEEEGGGEGDNNDNNNKNEIVLAEYYDLFNPFTYWMKLLYFPSFPSHLS